MAKFLEYQGKEWLAKGGMPVPKGRVASSPEEAEEAARWIGGPVAVKGQVQAGGRGKAGIVKLADTPEEARALAEEILAKTVKGLPVEERVLLFIRHQQRPRSPLPHADVQHGRRHGHRKR